MLGETSISIDSDRDITAARVRGREMAIEMGFTSSNSTFIATAISELARKIILCAKQGEITLRVIDDGVRRGIEVVARNEEGPVIVNPEQATRNSCGTSGDLAKGLAGVKRLMDEFEILSEVEGGTTVIARKWNPEATKASSP